MPSSAVRNVAAEALRTQSPDVMVFDITPFAAADREENNSIYRLLDNMKLSLNYLDMAEGYCEYAGVEGLEEMEYYIPLLRFHSRWKELQKADFVQTRQSYLNSNYASKFLKRKLGKDAAHSATDVRAEIGQKNEAALRELLEWCGGQEMEVLFYAAPVLREDNLERMNRAGDIVEEYGFPFLNFNDEALYAKLGFDEGQDYGDKNHTNLNGSYKFTKALGNYLKETYGLADHRGEEAYASWDEKAEAYGALVGKYLAYGK